MAISKIGSKALVDCSVAAVDIEDGSITGAKLAGSIANAKLANSSITVNGTAINLGASGSIPVVSWQSVVVSDGSTVTTMVAGNGYFVNNTSAAGLVKLPISASAGDTVAIKDYAGNFNTNNLTIQRNGHNIQGVANDSLISTDRASLTLVYVDATKGWLYAVESNVADLKLNTFIEATGGTVTTVDTDYKVHTFTGDGCFVVSSAGHPTGSDSVDYLVVAGAGGGGKDGGGAGGAGGYRTSFPGGTKITTPATTYPVTVGSGGAGSTSNAVRGVSGSNSIFSTITSAGGGGGGSQTPAPSDGIPGGSGGGGGGQACGSGGTGNTPPTSPPQGNNGGIGGTPSTGFSFGGGGGGAGAVGTAVGPSSTAPGGAGLANSITGSSVTRGGGGGGSGRAPGFPPAGAGGSGGGGAGGISAPAGVGTVNTGGGGGGSGGSGGDAGAGGSGIVVIRYKFQ